MPQVLRFGISSLDELLGVPSEKSNVNETSPPPPGQETTGQIPCGVYLPKSPSGTGQPGDEKHVEDFNTSVCIIGPTGTGKSIFALHMASRYLADCLAADESLPAVVYVSTDLTFNMAKRAWTNFALNRPFARRDPFDSASKTPFSNPLHEIELWPCEPTVLAEEFDSVVNERGRVTFVDMASHTAGDDWGFLHKLISLLPPPSPKENNPPANTLQEFNPPRHLIVIDAIEGFEALAGELNAFGQKSTRRSRIAQVMRLIAGKCHALLVVEESTGNVKDENLAEEFIADSVIRLDSLSTRNYERRVLKVEKVRGQSHIRGQHHYSIRSGKGSTTGSQVNPDDPEVSARSLNDESPLDNLSAAAPNPPQSYVQVFHSVHRLSRRIMEVKGKARERLKPDTYFAAFGIKYLDNMLGGSHETTERLPAGSAYEGFYYDTRGLPCRTTTALIGDSLTQKSTLGRAFMSRCFYEFDKRLAAVRRSLSTSSREEREVQQLLSLIKHQVELVSTSDSLPDTVWEAKLKATTRNGTWQQLAALIATKVGPNQPLQSFSSRTSELMALLGKEEFIRQSPRVGLAKIWQKAEVDSPLPNEKWLKLDENLTSLLGEEQVIKLLEGARLTHLAAWLVDHQSGVAVMLVTQNVHHEILARDFIKWLHRDANLKKLNGRMPGYEHAFENHIKGRTFCRRLEIHSLSSEVLIHMVQQLTKAAQLKILTPSQIQRDDVRYDRSWPIRLVIDDFSAFRDIFPELREDPLLLPSLLFHFEREGVTTLIVDTQSGKPDTPIAERFESELRKMVHHNLYTWRVPFYGESRVAITAIPPLSSDYAGIVRELRWQSESLLQATLASADPAIVDPHFELYTGLEEGNPQPVPLHVRFYAETEAMKTFIEIENSFLSERFAIYQHASQSALPCVIFGMPATSYDEMRDLAYLQRDTRFDHTLLFQVDEFWNIRKPSQNKRAGAFHPQWAYLNSITAEALNPEPTKIEDYDIDPNADPYALFQFRIDDPLPPAERSGPADRAQPSGVKSTKLRRRHFYEKYFEDFNGYDKFKIGSERLLIDRIPFSWDFGFLLCQQKAWQTNRTFAVKVKQRGKIQVVPHQVRKVWDSLTKAVHDGPNKENTGEILPYVSWRIFIEACKKVAEEQGDNLSRPVTAFDFAQISPESFSCLMLEIWLSEIYDSLTRKKKTQERDRILEALYKRDLFVATPENSGGKPRLTLADLLEDYWLELYRSWLLLIEVINFSDIIGDSTAFNFDFKSKNTDFSAISSRHWYKTASQCPSEIAAKDPLIAVRLPGRFSVRGDWFLSVSGGSRSVRQAERALDLLSSRRSNASRLQMGIGLPTRVPRQDPVTGKSSMGMLRTNLMSHERGQDSVDYQTFLNIAAPNRLPAKTVDAHADNFYWFWRSGLSDYAHCNRIWHKWLNRTILWWHRKLLRYKSVWVNSFEVYDNLTNDPPESRKHFAPSPSELENIQSEIRGAAVGERAGILDRHLKTFQVEHLAQLKVRSGFAELCDVLKEELKQASDTKRQPVDDR